MSFHRIIFLATAFALTRSVSGVDEAALRRLTQLPQLEVEFAFGFNVGSSALDSYGVGALRGSETSSSAAGRPQEEIKWVESLLKGD